MGSDPTYEVTFYSEKTGSFPGFLSSKSNIESLETSHALQNDLLVFGLWREIYEQISRLRKRNAKESV